MGRPFVYYNFISESEFAIMQSAIISTGGDTLTVGFSRDVNIVNSSGWSVEFDNLASRGITYVSGNGTTGITFNFESATPSPDGRAPIDTTCLLNYNANSGNVSNLLSFESGIVTNNSIAITLPDLPRNIPITTLPSGWNGSAAYTPVDLNALNALTSSTGALQPGDIVELSGTYSGLWNIHSSCQGTLESPIVFRTANHASLPPYGTRLTDSDEANLAVVFRTPSQASHKVMTIDKGSGAAGASHLRFIGIQFELNGSYATQDMTSAITVGQINGTTSLTDCPVGIGFNHCWLKCGTPEVQDCLRFDATDSWFVDGRFIGWDGAMVDGSTAIRTYVGGRLKFHNNYAQTESAGFFLGDNALCHAEDVEITNNEVTRPTGWDDGNGLQKAGGVELKVGRRVLIEGNSIHDATWQANAMAGIAIKSEPYDSSGGGGPKNSSHVTVRWNKIHDLTSAIMFHSRGSVPGTNVGPNHDFLAEQNLTWNTTVDALAMHGSQVFPMQRATIRHNTFIGRTNSLLSGANHLHWRDNIAEGVRMDGLGFGAVAFNAVWGSDYDARNSAFVGESISAYDNDTSPTPSGILTGNFFPTTGTVGFVDYANNDYRLDPSSVYASGNSGCATDGTDLGCDIYALNIIMSGVEE